MWNPVNAIHATVARNSRACARVAVRRFFCESSGKASVEYALFLTLIAACGIGAVEFLGAVTDATFQRLALDHGQITANLPELASTTIELSPVLTKSPSIGQTSPDVYQFALGAVGIIIGWLVWYRLYYRRILARRAGRFDDALDEQDVEDLSKRVFEKRQEILKILSGDWTGTARGEIEVGKLMSRNLCTIEANEPRSEVEALIHNQSLRHVIVVDGKGAVLGMISDRDLQNRSGKRASQIMTPDPFTVSPHSPITPAVTLLVNRRISCLPVVENGQLCGVLTTTDLIMALQCILQIFVRQSLHESNGTDNETIDAEVQSQHPDEVEATAGS